MIRPSGRQRRPNAREDAEARAEDLYKRMGASVKRMKAEAPILEFAALRDIRELLLHLVELVVLSAEEDR